MVATVQGLFSHVILLLPNGSSHSYEAGVGNGHRKVAAVLLSAINELGLLLAFFIEQEFSEVY